MYFGTVVTGGVILTCNSRVSDTREFCSLCFSIILFLLPCSQIKVTAGPASGQPSVSNQSHDVSCHRNSSAPSSSTVHSPARWGNTQEAQTTSPDCRYLVILHVGNWLCFQHSIKNESIANMDPEFGLHFTIKNQGEV